MERREENRRAFGRAGAGGRTVAGPGVSVPRVEEHVQVGKRRVRRGAVRLEKRVVEDEIPIDVSLLEEDVEIERVPIHQFVDVAPEIRSEGETLIIPCLEEVIVYEKRLRVREEIRVRRVRRTTHRPITVTARREEIEVERQPNQQEEEES
jgi:uncharacterized protein (TIGR02271 family)